ncbi:MAG: hypothetical protein ACLGH3_06240 [Actinomycetota bacterium]
MRTRSTMVTLSFVAVLIPAVGRADTPVRVERGTEPVVLQGSAFPSWSAGPDLTFREPQSPTNYDTFDAQRYLPEPLRSDCYAEGEGWNPYDDGDNGDRSCVQESRLPRNPNTGAPTNRLLGYRWNGDNFEQIPFQVDERFVRYLSNNASGFAFYSGIDQDTSYAYDREGFRYSWDEWLDGGGHLNPNNGGDVCKATPRPGTRVVDGYGTTPDPVVGLDDNDELVFMWSDAGAQAPVDAVLPDGIVDGYEIAVADPSDPEDVAFAYIMQAAEDGPQPAFDETNGYVRYERDADADMFVYSQSSYDGYGAAPKGPYCDDNGAVVTTPRRARDVPASPVDPLGRAVEQRRPKDTAWVKTPTYWFRYEGRWLMTQIRVSPDGSGLEEDPNMGPDLVDQWKARAFQQRPGGTTPCCGYEEEVNNWGGSSILMGERWGPVRVIRTAWGADSSTNNVKTEIFYRDEVRASDALRVHVIPPADGIYVQWDYNAGKVSTYYNPWVTEGVPIDGKNDEVFGNTRVHIAQDRLEVHDDDPVPVIGPQHHEVPLAGGEDKCEIAGQDGVCNDLDFADPFFSGPAAALNWEQIAGPYGSIVARWNIREHTGGDAYSIIAQPYYRDDSCFDDGTGSDPGPHLRSRGVDDGPYATYTDRYGEIRERICWDADVHGDPQLDPDGPRKFWQGDIGTHGVHIQIIADSDNANMTVPLTEMMIEQRMVILPGEQPNVGELYGRNTEFPLQVRARPLG